MPCLIPNELCTRCGACFAADSRGVLSKDNKGYPVYKPENVGYVNQLLDVCSGENWNYRELLEQQYGKEVEYDPSTPDIGQHLGIYLLSSSDSYLRNSGQSGGVTSTLLKFAFESNLINSALAVRRPSSDEGDPFSSEPYIVRNLDDLSDSFGSKYSICSTLELIKELSQESDAFAATLLPCQTVGFKRLVNSWDPSLRNKCKLIIGPYCGLNLEAEVGKALAEASGVSVKNVLSFKNRGGRFPGKTTFHLKSKEDATVDRTAHRILYRMYSPLRCYTCTDYGNELADITVADCWERSNGDFRFPEGAAYVICRTSNGLQHVNNAIEKGYLQSFEIDEGVVKKHWEASFYHRKVRAHNRIRYWRKRGKPVPRLDYDMPVIFKASLLSDSIELMAWRIFRNPRIRRHALSVWIWLAKGNKGSLRSLFFADLKRYFFTHTYDQFNLRMLRITIGGYGKWLIKLLKWK